MKNENYKTKNAILSVDNQNIIHLSYLKSAIITLTDAKEEAALCTKISRGEKILLVVDLSNLKSTTKEARNYYAGDEWAKVFTAVALICGSPISKMIGNFFLGINKPKVSLKLYSDKNEGIKWLTGLVNEKSL